MYWPTLHLKHQFTNTIKIIYVLLGGPLSLLTIPLASQAQHLETVGFSSSLNVTQTPASPDGIYLAPDYAIATNGDGSKYDETGYRLAAFARWQVGPAGFFVQPEIGYTSTMGQRYLVLYDLQNTTGLGASWFIYGHDIRRWETSALAGLHVGRRGYITLGPVVAVNQREPLLAEPVGTYPASAKIYNALSQSVITCQALAQLGIGITWGRFDFNARLEHSLTPYTRKFIFDGNAYRYTQHIRQGLLTVGFLLYKHRSATDALRY